MELIQVGKIVNTHGIKGAVKVFLFNDDVDLFEKNKKFYIDSNILVTIKSARKIKTNLAIIEFNEYNNINEILEYVDLNLYVEEENLSELSDGEYYVYKLIGLDVYDQNGQKIGKLKNVLSTLANDVYEIEYNKKIVYVPAVSQFIDNVDFENNKIIIKFLEGMLDD